MFPGILMLRGKYPRRRDGEMRGERERERERGRGIDDI